MLGKVRGWIYSYREVIVSLLVGGATIALWGWEKTTGLSTTENLLATIAIIQVDFSFVMVSNLFRRFSQVEQLFRAAATASTAAEQKLTDLENRGLNQLVAAALDADQNEALQRAEIMVGDGKYFVDWGKWYLETTRLCKSMKDVQGELMAISAYNIVHFMNDDNAREYLRENAELVRRGIQVRRIFVLDGHELLNRDIRYILQEHDRVLSAAASDSPAEEGGSGVKWILRRHAGSDGAQDFALFHPYVVARQRPGGQQLEVSQIQMEVNEAADAFERLWGKETAKNVGDLPPLR